MLLQLMKSYICTVASSVKVHQDTARGGSVLSHSWEGSLWRLIAHRGGGVKLKCDHSGTFGCEWRGGNDTFIQPSIISQTCMRERKKINLILEKLKILESAGWCQISLRVYQSHFSVCFHSSIVAVCLSVCLLVTEDPGVGKQLLTVIHQNVFRSSWKWN